MHIVFILWLFVNSVGIQKIDTFSTKEQCEGTGQAFISGLNQAKAAAGYVCMSKEVANDPVSSAPHYDLGPATAARKK